jgi:lactate dehydrogenase-like 2-hydroxyacid dehydrogenase
MEYQLATPFSLKFICNVGAGYDTIDVVTSAKRGIYLSNTPGAVDAVSVAEAERLAQKQCQRFLTPCISGHC